MKGKTQRQIKIGTRLSAELMKRLELLCAEAGFKSTYALTKYLLVSFIRAYDENHGTFYDTIPLELIEALFPIYKDRALVARAVWNIQHREKWRNDKRRQRARLKARQEPGDVIGDEIREMFSDCQEAANEMEFKPAIRKRE